jgi:uncharacterized DUF497 family protein
MTPLSFEWDKQKNQTNQKKHGVSFQEAESVFYDEKAIQFWDDEHSEMEDRFFVSG